MADVTRIANHKKRARGPRRRPTPRATIPSFVHEAQITTLINLAARLTGKAARLRMGRIGAWPGQIPLLLWLLEKDGVIQKELVERTNMEQSTVAEHLDRMERDGLVSRERGRDDRRKYRFYLTPKARVVARDLIGWLESGAELFTKGIPKDDLAAFARIIRQIIANLDDYIHSASARRAAQRRRPARAPKRASAK
ncbi:MAG TPA: MarR family winged helix-turn-helix transcriptional regulator [Stellaceae bacterium]|nr:MarR family winged helix-turn-helix transcriptional regulator [Stellaceae bacterium]